MTIQKAALNDLNSLTELFDLYRLFYEQSSDREGAREYLKERMKNKESAVFIAYEKNHPIGFVQLYPSFSSVSMKKTWILNDLFVKESARKKGFGEKLLKKAIDYASKTGAASLSLETGNENTAVQSLYEKIGFKRNSHYFYDYSFRFPLK
ncbi:GNAT family N-acetyltransferase [Alteribacillus sp. JSM 102045]|uniref:GNAT family N-acetyltransferase n=1 Tax=Alteribacillus sp. JSM 102045 TaxID=1562101 RepID=UPI0035C1D7A6